MKKIIYTILFIIILGLIIYKLDFILALNDGELVQYEHYYKEKNMDIVFIGSSLVYRSYSPIEIAQQYGIKTYVLGQPEQYYKNGYYMVKEAIHQNSPKLIVYDLYTHFKNINKTRMTTVYNMKASINKFNALIDLYNFNLLDIDSYKYLFSFNLFHDRWKELKKYDFNYIGDLIFYGYPMERRNFQTYKATEPVFNDSDEEYILDKERLEYIDKIYNYAKKMNTNIIFTYPSTIFMQDDYERAKAFEKYAKEKGYDYINYYNYRNKFELNYQTDLYDRDHFNQNGVRKFMHFSIPLYMEKYNIISNKDLKLNEKITQQYWRLANRDELKNTNTLNRWLEKIQFNNYLVIINSYGDSMRHFKPDIFNNLKLYKIDNNLQNYIGIINSSVIYYENASNSKIVFNERLDNQVHLEIISDSNKSKIKISGKEYSKNKYGLNFVVYDKINRQVVDSIWIEPSTPTLIKR